MNASVVVGYDPAPHSELALAEAAEEAVRRDAALFVVHVFDPASTASPPNAERTAEPVTRNGALRIAEQAAAHVRSEHTDLEVHARASAGPAPAVLTESARDADLLVVGHRGHGCLAGLVRDSVAARLAARPVCPTMVVRSRRSEPHGTVLAAIDLEDPVETVLAFAFDEARRRRTALNAVSVREHFWPPVYAGDPDKLREAAIQAADNAALALEDLLKPWQAEYPDIHVRHELVDGPPGAILTAAASYADLVIVGAHRHGAVGLPAGDAHIGPTINPLLLRAACPVAIIPRDWTPARRPATVPR